MIFFKVIVKIKLLSAFWSTDNCSGCPRDNYLFVQFRGLKNMSETISRLKIRDIAPNFSFWGQHEKIKELENLKGKIVVLFFVRSLF